MRPPAPGARFFIPTWVPVDELTPEEQTKYRVTEETPAPSESGDTEMAAADKKLEENPQQQKGDTVTASVTAIATENSDVVMATAEDTPAQQPDSTAAGSALDSTEESTEMPKPASLSPLDISRDTSTSEGIPVSDGNVAKALESVEAMEESRPHDPIADTLAESASAPPSRPVSEPATILLKEPAASVMGESVISPVPVPRHVPPKDSTAAAPSPASDDSSHFVHSGSDSTPFHAPTKEGKDTKEAQERPPIDKAEASEERVSEPETKRPRLE